MDLHKRKCHGCANVAEHSDSVVPEVLCKKCGSQDTRRIRTQLDHWNHVCDRHAELSEFVRWLDSIGVILDCDGMDQHAIDEEKPERLIDRFLKVDRVALDKERVAALEAQRIANKRNS